MQSDEETEVFFNINTNDSNSEKGHKRNKNRDDRRLSLSDFADECEILQTEDDAEVSMRKFASFLERNGYIKKVDQSESDNVQPSTSKAKSNDNQGKPRPGNISESEVTIYRNAVPLELSNEIENKGLTSNEKRISSSSEETESSPNTSGELTVGREEVISKQGQENLGKKERVLYQKFLDCRLCEQRELVRNKEDDEKNRQNNESKDR